MSEPSPYAGTEVLSLFRGAITIPATKPRLAGIAAEVAGRYGLSVADLRIGNSSHKFSHPRQEAMALSYATGLWSTTQIGRYYGRDHTTVIHARRRYAARQAEAARGVAE